MRGPRRRAAVTVHGADQGERDRRTQRRIERKVAKVEQQTHGGYAGDSIIEAVEKRLLRACIRYLEVKKQTEGEEDEEYTPIEWIKVDVDRASKRSTARGVVRGLAEAVAHIRNPYTALGATSGVEREFMRRARKASDAG
jgi:hypothetical protein